MAAVKIKKKERGQQTQAAGATTRFQITNLLFFLAGAVSMYISQSTLGSDISYYDIQFDILPSNLLATFDSSSSSSATDKTFVVWTFPFPPPRPPRFSSPREVVSADETLLCHYDYACSQFTTTTTTTINKQKVNLRSLTAGSKYEHYIRDHAYHKVRHLHNFPYHLQAITMISVLTNHPGKASKFNHFPSSVKPLYF